jgi:hypothetical protein
MSSLSILPVHYDVPFIIKQADVTNHYGWKDAPDGIHFRYQFEDHVRVQEAIEQYPVSYLTVMVPEMLLTVSEIRDERIKAFTFGGMTIEIDSETKTNLNGCVIGLDRQPEVAGINWSLGNGEFIFLDRTTVYALADAAFMHVQRCFTAHKAIVDEIKAAANIGVLTTIDIANHPAWTAE